MIQAFYIYFVLYFKGFPCGSAGKESDCNAGDLGSILGWEDPLEKEKATHSSILAWVVKSWTRVSDFHFHFLISIIITSAPPQIARPWILEVGGPWS